MHAVDAQKRLLLMKTSKKSTKNLIEIAETLKISKERVGYILHEYLDMWMLCAKWVPRMSTIVQKQQRVDGSEQCLAIFNRNKDNFFRRYITMDETWLFHYTPESNRQSAEWTERDEPNPKRGKTQRSAGISITRCTWYYIHRLPPKGPDHQQLVLHSIFGAFKRWNQEKKGPIWRKKSAVSSRQCSVSHINQNDGNITWIRLRIASPFIVISRSGLQWLFSVCRPEKNACWEEI
jgi:hypothetical protein